MTVQDAATARKAWLSLLVHELFQTEESACEHPILEADRLGDTPPARVLREVAAHATEAMQTLLPLTNRHDRPNPGPGRAFGAALSAMRDYFLDMLLSSEKSYRGTLIGMRHGVDAVELIEAVAHEEGDEDLAVWCGLWLEKRRPLVEAAARQLAWFAEHPVQATGPAKPDNPLARSLQIFVRGCQNAALRLRGANASA